MQVSSGAYYDGNAKGRWDDPTGFFPTTPTQRGGLTVSSGGESANNNFGLIQAGNLRLGAFHDRNMNGVKEAGEEGVSGWTFSRTAPAGGVATSDTEADGTITHQNLQPGSWQVSGETPVPSEWISTTSTSGTVPVPSGGTGEFQLGLVKPTLICGTVFLDDNQNGTLDAGERIKPNSAVTLSGSDLSGKTHSITGLSDGAGEYCFSVPPGTYSVTITTPDGFTLTTPPAYTGIGTGSGQTSSGNDFDASPKKDFAPLVIRTEHACGFSLLPWQSGQSMVDMNFSN